jgi:sugar phosphate isomerase/epimerase
MTSWPIGLSTGCFYNRNILDCLPLIRESGFDTIEVCSSPNHLDYHDQSAVQRAASCIKELHLEAYSLHAPFAAHIDISATNPVQRDASVAEIFKAAEAAALLNAHYFVIHPGPENPAPSRGNNELSQIQHVIESLDRIAKRCRELGTICILENKLPHLLFGNTSEILWILDAIKSVEVGACLDTGHAFLSGDINVLVQKLRRRLKMIHAHDGIGSNDDHLAPGDGKIDWVELMRELVKIDFHGAFILEMAGTADSALTMTNARRGRAYLRSTAKRLSLEAS